uniref:Uncharacterized protein n=1 Tax=Oryza glumipatula TaxID=40148 RepID=A0A0D9ZZD0_9ORYZ
MSRASFRSASSSCSSPSSTSLPKSRSVSASLNARGRTQARQSGRQWMGRGAPLFSAATTAVPRRWPMMLGMHHRERRGIGKGGDRFLVVVCLRRTQAGRARTGSPGLCRLWGGRVAVTQLGSSSQPSPLHPLVIADLNGMIGLNENRHGRQKSAKKHVTRARNPTAPDGPGRGATAGCAADAGSGGGKAVPRPASLSIFLHDTMVVSPGRSSTENTRLPPPLAPAPAPAATAGGGRGGALASPSAATASPGGFGAATAAWAAGARGGTTGSPMAAAAAGSIGGSRPRRVQLNGGEFRRASGGGGGGSGGGDWSGGGGRRRGEAWARGVAWRAGHG